MDKHLRTPSERMIAKALVCNAHRLYSHSLASYEYNKPWAIRMRNPEVGDIVVELTGYRHPFEHRVGTLISITDEPYDMPDWDEKEEGRPVPTRPIYTLALLSGETFRWEDCIFVSLPTTESDPL